VQEKPAPLRLDVAIAFRAVPGGDASSEGVHGLTLHIRVAGVELM
jgi:hypothetical protein